MACGVLSVRLRLARIRILAVVAAEPSSPNPKKTKAQFVIVGILHGIFDCVRIGEPRTWQPSTR